MSELQEKTDLNIKLFITLDDLFQLMTFQQVIKGHYDVWEQLTCLSLS